MFPLNVTRTELEILKPSVLSSRKSPGFIQDDGDKVRVLLLLQTIEKAIYSAKAQGWYGGPWDHSRIGILQNVPAGRLANHHFRPAASVQKTA